MTRLSRRQLATYGADQILAGESTQKVSARLAAVLSETKRTNDAELLARDIAWELETRGKLASANITSASQLTDELRSELANFIKSTAKVDKVSLQENIDKSVLGGVRIETAVHSWDKTVAKKLRNIRETVK
jgi:F-type H+-transporting ATPase subunit delta